MNTLELKTGDKIGVFFYDDKRGTKAVIDEVIHVSSSGTITLKNGTRYNRNGREVGALGEATYLCTPEKAQSIIDKASAPAQDKEVIDTIDPLEERRNKAAKLAVKSVIHALNQYGWYADIDGHMDVMEAGIEQIIKKYLSEHEPIN
ncbi:hypothetical protein VF14_13455 [Nostoc linckia z18]|uniref:Uncharacterized protein n=2 Tax=Nostoc linckia TaxID=92942 RepID=A0A9Q6EL12_NOSLI|nr:hypothetical protein [Nostoc linckia]PHK42274.1 hypothetical protein VF12_03710 [Nostoc linckia z15]PHK45481.1 hypothetical protein VF13_16160 [Nostoc linckia z16]PHJ59059.1 hypothetical protein VF02_26145 [Nostoc linckia z1]PHJ61912.1 hypothetical protein VF05_27840 [Nostoc linckia z3]PHJ67829.1 hypothetical protein VF03_25590 [Nostoc linckia z2]